MERCQSAVSDQKLSVLSYNIYLPFFLISIGLNGGNIAMLVISILLWVFSLFLTVIAAVALKKEISVKETSLFNFQILPLWSKITYIVLFAIECLFLLVVLLLWISAGAIPDSPNSEFQ